MMRSFPLGGFRFRSPALSVVSEVLEMRHDWTSFLCRPGTNWRLDWFDLMCWLCSILSDRLARGVSDKFRFCAWRSRFGLASDVAEFVLLC